MDNKAELEQLLTKDRLLFNLSDTLDMKASVSLIVVTFLAALTADFLAAHMLSDWIRRLQILAAIALAIGGICAMVVLWPRVYAVEKAEEFGAFWEELVKHYKGADDADQQVKNAYLAGRIKGIKAQISANRQVDDRKSQFLSGAYKCAGVALLLNLITLVCVGFS